MIVSGAFVFELKATHGLPLEMAIDRIILEKNMRISWADYIEAARLNGWYDFQIFESIRYGLQESMIDKEKKQAIIDKTKIYLLKTFKK